MGPLNEESTSGPSTRIARTITPTAKRAMALAFASLDTSRYKDRGYEISTVHAKIIKRRDVIHAKNPESPGCTPNSVLNTGGIVSPIITLYAHIPPKAIQNWKKEMMANPLLPKSVETSD